MRTPSEIFKLLVEREIYNYTCPYMCIAMGSAEADNVISRKERLACKTEIEAFLVELTLEEHLNSLGKVSYLRYLKAIYLNWDNRAEVLASIPDIEDADLLAI